MKCIDTGTDTERIICRCRIEGRFMGEDFIYEDPPGVNGSYWYWVKDNDPSTHWWTEGNFGCDCNRHIFLPLHLQEKHDEGSCGENIKIKRIVPLEGDNLPVLELDEY